jgi:PmbA protein
VVVVFEMMDNGLRKALHSVDQVEIYAERGNLLQLGIEKEKIKEMMRSVHSGVGVRVIDDKKIGFSYTNDMNMERCVERAISMAKVSRSDPHLDLPVPRGYPRTSKTLDQRILDIELDDAFEYCEEILSGAKNYDDRIRPTGGDFSAGYGEVYISNSEGIEVYDQGTYISGSITVCVGDEGISAWEAKSTRTIDDIDFGWIGENAARVAIASMNPRRIETKTAPVILMPRAMEELLSYTTISQLNAENVQRDQSPYVGRLGDEIASENLTMIDDGTLPEGIGSTKMDGEGVPTERTTLIEKGVLKSFLYNTYAANKDEVESTGNAVRGYDELPGVDITNFIVKSGHKTLEDLIDEMNKGLLITDVIGAHTAMGASGEFSVTTNNAFWIEKGERYPVKEVMISGNMPEVLMMVEETANDPRQIGNVISPSVRISKIQVIGTRN